MADKNVFKFGAQAAALPEADDEDEQGNLPPSVLNRVIALKESHVSNLFYFFKLFI